MMALWLYTMQHNLSVIKTNTATEVQSLSVLSSPSASVSHEQNLPPVHISSTKTNFNIFKTW
jgi:hypothetical protein